MITSDTQSKIDAALAAMKATPPLTTCPTNCGVVHRSVTQAPLSNASGSSLHGPARSSISSPDTLPQPLPGGRSDV